MSIVSTVGDAHASPITRGRLKDFPEDPIACMQRLFAEHGDLAALEEEGQRIVFAIGPHFDNICFLTAQMLDGWQNGDILNIHQEVTQHMLRVTSSILFGFDVPELSYSIGQMIDHWVKLNHQTGLGALQGDANLHDGYEQLLDHAVELEAAVRQMIEMRRADCDRSTDVLSLLIRANQQDKQTLSDDELIDAMG